MKGDHELPVGSGRVEARGGGGVRSALIPDRLGSTDLGSGYLPKTQMPFLINKCYTTNCCSIVIVSSCYML